MKKNKLKPPEHLSAQAKALWRSTCENYDIDEQAGLVLLAGLEAVDRRTEARKMIAAEGAIQTDRFGQKKPHPAVGIERDSAQTLMKAFRLLGMDLAQPGAPVGKR